MIKKTLNTFILGLIFVVTTTTYAQKTYKDSNHKNHRGCGVSKHYEALKNDSEYATSFYKRKAKFERKIYKIQKEKSLGIHKRSSTLYIPVAVHFETGSESNRACLEAYAQTQIDVINADYTATNSNINLWEDAAQYYPGLQPGSVNIQFCIATKNHPEGSDPEVQEGSPLVTIGSNGSNFGTSFPEQDSTYSGYMNFIIKDLGSGLLGYSPLLGSIAGGHAVVMNTICFGTGEGCSDIVPQYPYNLGRTVTHELGHFYNLNHTFKGGCSGNNDDIDDTPAQANQSGGNPANGSIPGCVDGEYTLFMNYMDYTDDRGMYMFTPDQATVIEAYFETFKDEFKTDVIDCQEPTFNIKSNDIEFCDVTSTSATINYIAVNGFNETTTLSLENVPLGVTYTFSPTTLNENGTTTLALYGLDNLTSNTTPFTLVGTSNSLTKTLTLNLVKNDAICEVSSLTEYNTSITNVAFNEINHMSSPDEIGADNQETGYSDFTETQSATVNIGDLYELTVKVNGDGYNTNTKVWIDWNQNCLFNSNESYDLGGSVNGTNNSLTLNSPLTITVPPTAITGVTTMRVVTDFYSPKPCGINEDGEVEDYSINITNITSTNEKVFSEFEIYPNPVKHKLNISLSTIDDVEVSIFDITGRRVYLKAYTNNKASFSTTLNLDNISAGNYILSVKSANKIANKKIIIK